jgi:uroporphyrinogen-III synthase
MFTVAEEYSRVEGLRRDLSKVAVAAIGPKTAETLTTLGVTVNVIPTTYSVEGLVYALVDELCRRN